MLGCRGYQPAMDTPAAFADVSPVLVSALAQRIRHWQLGILIIQEAPPQEWVTHLGSLCNMHTTFFPAQSEPGPSYPFGFPGAVLSRFPLSDEKDCATAWRSAGDPCFARFWGTVQVHVHHLPLCVGASHFCSDWGGVNRESTRLAEAAVISKETSVDVLGIDCNAQPNEQPIATMRAAGWRDAWVEARNTAAGATILANQPSRRIDYLWLAPTSPWRVRSAQVINDVTIRVDGAVLFLSDHCPVLVELEYIG